MRARPRLAVSIVVLASLSLAGCAPASEGRIAEIVNGSASPSDDAVVFLLGAGFCSGTLIAPRVVLTAKHCVVREGEPEPIAASAINVAIGESFRELRARYGVDRVITTPGPLVISEGFDPVGGANGSDIALLVLRRPVTEAAPIPVYRGDPNPLVGSTLRAIGFGNTPSGSSGLRLQVEAELTRTTPVLLEGIEVICSGDSGGPLLVETDGARAVVGVASFGVFRSGAAVGSCPADADYWNRVDVQMDLIDRALRISGECVASGAEACNGVDDDCNGQIDETCVAIGGACSADSECAFAAPGEALAGEEELPSAARCAGGVCVLGCDAREPLESCAAIEHPFTGERTPIDGFHCRHEGGCLGVCVAGGPGPVPVGGACTVDDECASLACDLGVCSTRCVGDAGTCPVGEACIAEPGACGICAGAASRATGRGRGEPCSDAGQCLSGTCGPAGECTSACSNDGACGAGFRCEDGLCARGARAGLGEPCTTGDDCTVGECGSAGGASFCGAVCDEPGDCASASCVASAAGGVCAPDEATLGMPCAADEECAFGVCRGGVCTAVCSATRYCPVGTSCVRSGADTVCRAPGGGCSAGAGRSSSGLVLGLVLAWLSVRARRAQLRSQHISTSSCS